MKAERERIARMNLGLSWVYKDFHVCTTRNHLIISYGRTQMRN